MNITQIAEVARKYYDKLRQPSVVQGWEKYVLTDGSSCLFVKSDYIPKQGEAVFYITTRNCNTMCQLHREYTPIDKYTLRSIDNLHWEARDNEANFSIRFLEGAFNDARQKFAADHHALNGIGRWLWETHPYIYTCDKAARNAIIHRFSPYKHWWATLADALNGLWITGEETISLRTMLLAHMWDYFNAHNPFSLDDKDELVELLRTPDEDCKEYYPSDAELTELVNIIRAFWDSDRYIITWDEDINKWPDEAQN